MSDLPQQLRDLADSLESCEWNHPLGSADRCREAAGEMERMGDENHRLTAEITRLSRLAIERNGKIIELTDAIALQAEELHDEITRLTAEREELADHLHDVTVDRDQEMALRDKAEAERDEARNAARFILSSTKTYYNAPCQYDVDRWLERWPWLEEKT